MNSVQPNWTEDTYFLLWSEDSTVGVGIHEYR